LPLNGQIRLPGKVWSDEFGEERVPGWIEFYDRMFSSTGRAGYQKVAAALKSLPPVYIKGGGID